MIKKLNNKGFTTIEVILCFVLVVIITTSLYTTITSFNEKRITEEYKSKIYTYKNLLTKEIQDDILKKGLIAAEAKTTNEDKQTLEVLFSFKDGSEKTLLVEMLQAQSSYHPFGSTTENDYYMIKYGSIEYPLPELGEYVNEDNGLTIKDLSISSATCQTDNNILRLHINLYHPDLGYRYSINIICPINYIDSGSLNSGVV